MQTVLILDSSVGINDSGLQLQRMIVKPSRRSTAHIGGCVGSITARMPTSRPIWTSLDLPILLLLSNTMLTDASLAFHSTLGFTHILMIGSECQSIKDSPKVFTFRYVATDFLL